MVAAHPCATAAHPRALVPLLVAAALVLPPASAASCARLAVNTATPINKVGSYYASWNVDASRDRLFFDVPWTNPVLVKLLSQIGGSHIRFGGTGNDALYYGLGGAPPCAKTVDKVYECLNVSTWSALAAISAAASSPLVVGVNIHPAGTSSPPAGPWDGTNARALFSDAKARGVRIAAAELGNEQVRGGDVTAACVGQRCRRTAAAVLPHTSSDVAGDRKSVV